MERPSYRELNSKIAKATNCIENRKCNFENPTNLSIDLIELGISFVSLYSDILKLVNEITPNDYAGSRPPQRSYGTKIKNCELFAFSWDSNYLDMKVYLKFSFQDDFIWISSLHKDNK